MELIINGDRKDVAAADVAALVEELGLAGQAVAVEVNERLVPKREHGQVPLSAGDRVELVTLVGGG